MGLDQHLFKTKISPKEYLACNLKEELKDGEEIAYFRNYVRLHHFFTGSEELKPEDNGARYYFYDFKMDTLRFVLMATYFGEENKEAILSKESKIPQVFPLPLGDEKNIEKVMLEEEEEYNKLIKTIKELGKEGYYFYYEANW